jgi:myo-inositol-1(or 4)-monophosphatase
MHHAYDPLTQVAIEAALEAGKILQRGYGTKFKIGFKPGVQNYVTEFDHAAEECIIKRIKSHYPKHAFLCEESGLSDENYDGILWIIDPLDGTTNFAHNIPIFCVSIAAYQHEEPLCGVIFQPLTHELFVAEKGKGTFLNNTPLQTSTTPKFAGGMGATGFPRNIAQNPNRCIDHFIDILKSGTLIRNLGSSALNLAYVAAGRFDAYWAISLHSWDIAAGKLLIEEAGGLITTYTGEKYPVLSNSPLVASNRIVHEELLRYLHDHQTK